MSLPAQFGALRTGDLRALLQDEPRIQQIIRSSEKVQELQRAADKMMASNQTLAKVALSQKPHLRDAKLLLAVKYKEAEKLLSIIQAKQDQLAERHSVHFLQLCLLKKINPAEEECELLFQRFVEGKTPLADFLDSFVSSRKLQHIRLVVVKKLQEMIELESTQNELSEVQTHACLPVCSLTTAVVLPACCHPPILLPFGLHVDSVQCHLPFYPDYHESLRAGVRGRGPKWPTRPVCLQPLKMQQRRHQEAPQ